MHNSDNIMPQFQVFVTRRLPAALDRLQEIATVEVWPERQPPTYEVLREKVEEIDGLLCLLTDRIDRQLLETGTKLKVVSQMAVGYDNIDISAATARGIPVGHTPGVLTDATADFTWALLMAAARRVVEADKFTGALQWRTWEPDLDGSDKLSPVARRGSICKFFTPAGIRAIAI
jgi:glyoxylate reductase